MSINSQYLFQSGDLKLKDGIKYQDVLCIDVNESFRLRRGVPRESFLFLDNRVEPFSVKFIDVASFKTDQILQETNIKYTRQTGYPDSDYTDEE